MTTTNSVSVASIAATSIAATSSHLSLRRERVRGVNVKTGVKTGFSVSGPCSPSQTERAAGGGGAASV